MHTRFYAKTWISWAQLLILGSLGSFSVFFGILCWTGIFHDVNDQPRPAAGPPMVIIGTLLLLGAIMALCTIITYRRPLLNLCSEGIEVSLSGQSVGIPLPRQLAVFYLLLTFQAFRAYVYRLRWEQFHGAVVEGLPMARLLLLHGRAENPATHKVLDRVTLPQHLLEENLDKMAAMLNALAVDPPARAKLPPW
jgi:hypothetical protein